MLARAVAGRRLLSYRGPPHSLSRECRAVVCSEFGGPEVMEVRETVLPELQPGQVLVKMRAAGVNPSDTYMRLGPHGPWGATPHLLPPLPFTPGKDGAGVVEAVGEGVGGDLAPGTRVYTTGSVTGTYATHAICEQTTVALLPDNVSYEQGACLGVPASTAYRALFIRCGLQPTDRVFVHGASGAVGLAAVQMAADLGCFVVGSAGTEEGEAAAKRAGAHVTVNRHTTASKDGWTYLDAAKEATAHGEGFDGVTGFDVLLEMMASSNLSADLPLMRRRGRVAIIGSKAEGVEINPRQIMAAEVDIKGVFLPTADAAEAAEAREGMYEMMTTGALQPIVSMKLGLVDAPTAHREVMAPSKGGSSGNIVIDCTE